MKDPAGATKQAHKGKHPGCSWASADLKSIRKARWEAGAGSWLWSPTNQSNKSPWPKHAPPAPPPKRQASRGRKVSWPFPFPHCLWLHKGLRSLCSINDSHGPEIKSDPTERNVPRMLKSWNLVLSPTEQVLPPLPHPGPHINTSERTVH